MGAPAAFSREWRPRLVDRTAEEHGGAMDIRSPDEDDMLGWRPRIARKGRRVRGGDRDDGEPKENAKRESQGWKERCTKARRHGGPSTREDADCHQQQC